MYDALVKLMILAALNQLGLTLADIVECRSRQCQASLARKSHKILDIQWKPISVFPEEARRFQKIRE